MNITMEDVQASKLNDEGLSEAEVAACLIGTQYFSGFSPEEIWDNEFDFYIVLCAANSAASIADVRKLISDEWIPTMAFPDYDSFLPELGGDDEDFLTSFLKASKGLREFCADNDIPLIAHS